MLNTDIQYFKTYNIGNRQKLEFRLLACFLGVFIQGRFMHDFIKSTDPFSVSPIRVLFM